MNFISTITAPVVWLLSSSTNAILKLLRQSNSDQESVTEEEVKAMIIQGTSVGVFEETEQELMESVIRLDDQNITALMTPRTKIGWINSEDSDVGIRQQIREHAFSRLLVGEGDLDNIQGFVKAKDILNFTLMGNSLDIEAVIKQPLFIPETVTALEVLERFRESDTHLAVIIDEFGSTHGVITTNDILKAIVGDISVGETQKESSFQRKDGSWLLDARLSNTDFCDVLNIKELPEDEFGMYETLAGFIIKRLEKFPATGDKFDWENYTFEIIDMDGKRIDKVLVSSNV
jgi:putative hemolysin